MANSSFAFGNFLEFFPLNIFDLRLVESANVEAADRKGQTVVSSSNGIKEPWFL